ncbi:MAG: hypothetical protein M3322_06525 [Actinomycetota bacterium]|nr:hypothetical protein [Actinomycetota bacterium]
MELRVDPVDGLVDELPRIDVTDAPEGRPIEFELSVTDAAGHQWRSRDGEGAAALFWNMEFVSEEAAPTAFVAPADLLEYRLEARCGDESDAARLIRRWSAEGVERSEVRGDGFAGALFSPAAARGQGVLVLPGSTGVSAIEPLAALLASHGHITLAAAYMQEPGLPSALREIPVEVIGEALRKLEDIAGPPAVLAASLGTQGMLAALARGAAAATKAVAIAPSSVVWQALSETGRPPKTAAWSNGGEPLPWLEMHGERLLPEMVKHALLDRFSRHPRPRAMHMLPAYAPSLGKKDEVERASIPVEKIECPLLLLSGEDDQIWPAAEMGEAIAERRRDAGVGARDRLFAFPDAGHFLRPPITPTTVPWTDELVSGGSAEGNARAQSEGWNAILSFLRSP